MLVSIPAFRVCFPRTFVKVSAISYRVGDLVPPVGLGKLKSVATKDETTVRILDDRGRFGCRSGRDVQVQVIAKMEAEFVHGGGIERAHQRELQEMASRTVGGRKIVAR